MADYRFHVASCKNVVPGLLEGVHHYGYEIDHALPLTNVKFSKVVSTSSGLTGTLDPSALDTLSLDPPRDLLFVERAGEIEWGGIIWDLAKKSGETLVTVTAGSIWSWYQNKSEVREDINFSKQNPPPDILTVPQSIIRHAHASSLGGPLVIWRPKLADTLATNSPDITGTSAQKTGSLIEQLAQQDPGFDFDIRPQFADNSSSVILLVGRYYYPEAGRNLGLTLEWGAGISDYGWQHRGSLVNNDWLEIGQAPQGQPSGSVPTSRQQDTQSLARYLRLQGSESLQTSTTGILSAAAKRNLKLRAKPIILTDLVLQPGRHDTDASLFNAGDTIDAVVHDVIVQFDGPFSIASVSVALDDSGDPQEKTERVTLTGKQVQST